MRLTYRDENGVHLNGMPPICVPADANRIMTDAVDKLAAYEDAEEQGTFFPHWIPVTERLPEKRKWVLCRCEANIVEVLRWENNEWYHDPRHVYYQSFVTHWMPLPEPPKGE